jgi:acetyl-CoA carboxylase biotin carboxyl carrier protein
MDLDQIRSILDLVREHELTEFELEENGLRLKVRKEGARPLSAPSNGGAPAGELAVTMTPVPTVAVQADADIELAVVKSPIVGTFYRSPEPGAPPFVEVGDAVKKGQVLCIIEAMKLMNEIDSEYDGEVVSAYVENGQPVQYGERLFAIRAK